MAGLSHYRINETEILLGFDFAVDVSTLINDNFTLTKLDATPQENISDPFDEIVVTRDYHSTGRDLYLYWNTALAADTVYRITISNIDSVFGIAIPTFSVDFTTSSGSDAPFDSATPDSQSPWAEDNVEIEDWSILELPDPDHYVASQSNTISSILIESVEPELIEAYNLGPIDFNGLIKITFSDFIPANFINNTDFKLQKKLVSQRSLTSWENVTTFVSQQSDKPIVNIYLPSTDDPPIYSYEIDDLTDYVFWEPGHKYRLIISKHVGH